MEKLNISNKKIYNNILYRIPTDLILNTLTYLDIHTLCNISKTCKELHIISTDDYVWSNYALKYNIKDKNIKKMIKNKFEEFKRKIQLERTIINRNINLVTSSIYKYNYIIKDIYIKNKFIIDQSIILNKNYSIKYINKDSKNYKIIKKFGDMLEDLIKKKIFTNGIYKDTYNLYRLIQV